MSLRICAGITCLYENMSKYGHISKYWGDSCRFITICYIPDMRTISQTVGEIIQRSPFLAEAMAEGVGNNAQIARKIKREVENRLLENVSEAAIAMALHRMGKKFRRTPYSEKFLKQMNDITVRSNLVEFVCPSSEDFSALLETISKSARRRKDTFVHFSRGLHESLLVLDDESARAMSAALSRHKVTRRNDNVSR